MAFKWTASETNATAGAVGALIGLYVGPMIPFGGKYGELAIGAVAIVAGVYLDMDGVGAAILGAGVGMLIDGIVKLVGG